MARGTSSGQSCQSSLITIDLILRTEDSNAKEEPSTQRVQGKGHQELEHQPTNESKTPDLDVHNDTSHLCAYSLPVEQAP